MRFAVAMKRREASKKRERLEAKHAKNAKAETVRDRALLARRCLQSAYSKQENHGGTEATEARRKVPADSDLCVLRVSVVPASRKRERQEAKDAKNAKAEIVRDRVGMTRVSCISAEIRPVVRMPDKSCTIRAKNSRTIFGVTRIRAKRCFDALRAAQTRYAA